MHAGVVGWRARIRIAAAVLLALAAPAVAAAYPDHPIKVIVPYAAGGPADVTARLIFNKVGEKLGQSFLIDNRGGAGGNIGTVAGAGAAPDGYTLTVITPAQIINMTLFASPGYDVARDFTPVSLFTTAPGLLLVNPKLGVSTFAEMIALAKSKPGQFSFASQGVGVAPHLMMEMIKKRAGIDLVHVPYRGSAPALNDLLAGNVPMMIDSIVTGLPHVKSGALRGLAVSTRSAPAGAGNSDHRRSRPAGLRRLAVVRRGGAGENSDGGASRSRPGDRGGAEVARHPRAAAGVRLDARRSGGTGHVRKLPQGRGSEMARRGARVGCTKAIDGRTARKANRDRPVETDTRPRRPCRDRRRRAAHRAEIGSGRVRVLATPVMINLMEAAALDAVENLIPAGHQSLGTHLDVRHIAATPVGMRVRATARLLAVDGRTLEFRVEAHDEKDLIGDGAHTRLVVNVERFDQRVQAKLARD